MICYLHQDLKIPADRVYTEAQSGYASSPADNPQIVVEPPGGQTQTNEGANAAADPDDQLEEGMKNMNIDENSQQKEEPCTGFLDIYL